MDNNYYGLINCRCELRVVSDANRFFIETILKHHGILGCFTEINTNPSYVDEDGKLRIFPYHHFTATTSSHGCNLCPPNMCKGKIIERIQAASGGEGGKKQMIYIGDGKGDYCPSLRLRSGDIVMPRKNYPVWELITSNIQLIEAEVHEWSDAEEQQRILLQLIDRISIAAAADHSSRLLLPDCKLETTATTKKTTTMSHEALLPQALPVRH
ncbi:inorganic pyrophosphatase 1-like [Iris pallida]|uniref:Inorganic pyrophosphatase 1-like n=1 Tax=Iris pallida TaxID=29817 RepID=A0AAX6G307_IRIPA|nr:inorganic pyrophosphatase 1-like [Iris pallida]